MKVKRLLIMTLCITMLMSGTSVFAANSNNADAYDVVPELEENINENEVIYYVPEEDQEEELQKSIEKEMLKHNQGSKTRIPEYINYEFEVITTQYAYPAGYAGNQPSGGTRFASGGGFYHSDNGGPSASVSISVSGYGVGVGVSLGVVSASTSGYYCAAPNKTNYFKLHITKKVRVQKQAVYGYRIGSTQRQFLYYIYPQNHVNTTYLAKQV